MEIKGKNILVTGGAGFIGSHLSEEYLAKGARKVIVYDDFSTGNLENLGHIQDERLKIVKGSILDVDKLGASVKEGKVDVIDHLAAELEVYSGIKDPEGDARINIIGTLNVLNTALRNGVKRVLFFFWGGLR